MTKQVLDVQQMQHLQELGLDTSNASALYCIDNESGEKQLMWNEQVEETDKDDEYFRIVPAYTLHDVLDALPKNIYRKYIGWTKLEIQAYSEAKYVVGYRYIDTCDKYIVYRDGEELIDVAYTLLCWAIETGNVEM